MDRLDRLSEVQAGETPQLGPQNLLDMFLLYANFDVNKGVVVMDDDTYKYDSILLSQIDAWLIKAKIIGKELTLTETGMHFIRYKKWRIDYEEFLEFLDEICKEKEFNLVNIKNELFEVGGPQPVDFTKVV